ncbi:MAG TPA: LamG domain-containing protein [Puia sp.]
MKSVRLLLGIPMIYVIALLSGASFTGCMKTNTIHDTTRITVRDTVNTTDTLNIRDTVISCNCNLKDGLVAYYNFNGGNLNDSSGFHNNILFNNAVKTTDRFGKANNAYLFDGSSSYMQVPNSQTLNPDSITIFAIVKVNGFYLGPCADNQIVTKGDDFHVNGFYGLGFYDFSANCGTPNVNKESFGGSFGDNPYDGAAPYAGTDTVNVKTNQWYYVALTYDGATTKMYINGLLKDSKTRSGPFTPNAYDVFIGKSNSGLYPFYLNGVIDEVRIYNRALCAAAILQLSQETE